MDMIVLFIGNTRETPGLLENLYKQYVPCRVLSAPGAEQGVEIMRVERVDAVFVDFPLNGPVEAVRKLKEGAPDALVIILAEADAAQQAVKTLEDKVYDYVVRDEGFRNSLNRLVEITCSRHILKSVRLGKEALYSVLSREILKSKEQWQVTIDAVEDYIFVTDVDRVVKRANLSFARRFGKHPRGIVGMRADELLGSDVFFEDRALRKGIASKTPVTGEVSVGDETFTVSVFPAHFDDQEVYVYSAKDVTELRKLRWEILKSKEQWQVTIDAVEDYIFVTDVDRVVKRANLSFARRFGKHPRGIVGMRADELLGSDVFFEDSALRKGITSKIPVTGEVSVGDETFAVSVFPAHFDDQEVYVYSVKDITETKRLREQLYHADKLASIGLLVSGVAHEVNNPLTGILGYTEMLGNMTRDEGTRKYLEKIAAAAERCKSFVANLLSFSRQHAHQSTRESINNIIDKTLEIRAYWARSRNVAIKRQYGELPLAHVDGQRIQQVVLNLLMNAEQAIDGGGRQGNIVISTSFDEGEGKIAIKVSDNGQGIPQRQIDRIFDPFFTTKPPDTGTGLGLSIARGIIEEHRGSIDVESTEGQGTTFTVKLPLGNPR
jgi:signal transduction histidine kinase